jgi:uncharacterized membrane protein YeaQ/YmgE (transglycosylase-associated protein family)
LSREYSAATALSSRDLASNQPAIKPNYLPNTMSFIWMLIIGLVVGAIAKLLMPGRDPGGMIVTMILGVVGALIAGALGRAAGWYNEGEPAGFIASVVGAVLVLVVYRMIVGRRTPRVH